MLDNDFICDWRFWLLVIIPMLILLFWFMSYNSVYFESGGYDDSRGINWSIAEHLCFPNELIDIKGTCCYIQVYCERYKFPLHCYKHIGVFEDYNYCYWWFYD